jgi:hypothetical protein
MGVRAWLIDALTPAAAAVALLAGVVALGRLAREQLRPLDRYHVAFASIECAPPHGLSRSDFLDEVQYLSSCPALLPLLEGDFRARLRGAFERHPWVEEVEGVEVSGRELRVRLLYRKPVLAVTSAGDLRAVDRHGVLLPRTAATDGLPVFAGIASLPRGPAGTPWGDARVEAAARIGRANLLSNISAGD